MVNRRPVTDPASEVRLAQVAAERHPEVNMPDVPEGFGARYTRGIPVGPELVRRAGRIWEP